MDPDGMSRTLRKASRAWRTCLNPRWSARAATTDAVAVPCAVMEPFDCAAWSERSMIWETPARAALATWWSATRNTAASDVTATSTPLWMIWRCPRATIRIGWSRWRSAWWWSACPEHAPGAEVRSNEATRTESSRPPCRSYGATRRSA